MSIKKRFFFLLLSVFLFKDQQLFAQNNNDTTATLKIFKVGVFAPLYLDSVFTGDRFRYEKGVPKFIMPAVDFVQGAMIAFDTLSSFDAQIEAYIYDTKSFTKPLSWLIQNNKLDSLDLIIGGVKDVEFKELADYSSRKKIPFISSIYPNDGGMQNDPYLIILNSTLKAHCEGIFSYLLQNHGTDKIYLCKKPGVQEDKILGYFQTLNQQEGKPLLNLQVLNFDSTISSSFLKSKLDSNHETVIIGGSLEESFAKKLSDACYSAIKKYPVFLIGMPNWDGFKIFAKEDAYKDFPVHFTSPYYNPKTDIYSDYLTNEYDERFNTKPSDMAYKGFESVYLFTKLLIMYPDSFAIHLNDSPVKVFNDYTFRPILPQKKQSVPDYFENKHLYILRTLNGIVSREW